MPLPTFTRPACLTNTKGAQVGRPVAGGRLMADGSAQVNVLQAPTGYSSVSVELHQRADFDAEVAQAGGPADLGQIDDETGCDDLRADLA